MQTDSVFKVLLLSSHLLISRHPVQKSKFGAPLAFLVIFERGLGRVSKRHVRGRWKKALKFYGIYIEIKQLGHNVITSQHPISEASVGKFNVSFK